MSTPASYDDAVAWLDSRATVLDAEEIPVTQAAGRVLAAAVSAPGDWPASPAAAVDGFALDADATVGASDYNPLRFRVAARGPAVPVASGDPLPGGMDAVIPGFEVDARGDSIDVYTPVAAGENVIPAAREAGHGDQLMAPGRVLRPADAAWLGMLGVASIFVVRRPVVRVASVRSNVPDASGALVLSLLERDGALRRVTESAGGDLLPDLLSDRSADMLIVIGGSGFGANDSSAGALEAAGEVVFRGVAISPGETVTMGRVGGKMAMVLPGPPLASLFAYDALAGVAVRRLGGRSAEWPYATLEAPLERKIASRLGLLECCRVELADGRVKPIAVSDNRTLSTAVRADGFVLVPASSEGFAEGERVAVYLYDQRY